MMGGKEIRRGEGKDGGEDRDVVCQRHALTSYLEVVLFLYVPSPYGYRGIPLKAATAGPDQVKRKHWIYTLCSVVCRYLHLRLDANADEWTKVKTI